MRNKLLSLLLILLFVLGIGLFILPQRYESKMEKRLLATNESIVLDNKLSLNIENVLKDQFYFRDFLTHNYFEIKTNLNRVINKFVDGSISHVYKVKGLLNGGGTIDIDNDFKNDVSILYLSDDVIEINDGYLINGIVEYNDEQLQLASSRGYNVNEFDKLYPDVKTYIYFPTRLEEMLNSEKENRLLCRENYLRQLNGNISYSALKIGSVEDHQKYFYKSDEHWKAAGAYQGYVDIIDMISKDYELGPIKEIEKEIVYDREFKGNISSKIGMVGSSDKLEDYILKDLGEYDYFANGNKIDLNEAKELYAANGNDTVYSDYDLYFGDNYFLREFDFHQDDKPNILIFADSYINTNMSWIASHFNKTLIIDLRAKPNDFNLDYYINEYDIDIALIDFTYNTMYFNGNLYIPIN
ncbi:MAG: hypothetical protein IJH31_05535 [Erysipelotrichaceae bacterium]|nr:hypothetical protein [Erysipelotrichaceae bacterium]